jgi:hypothetical protein
MAASIVENKIRRFDRILWLLRRHEGERRGKRGKSGIEICARAKYTQSLNLGGD